MRDPLLWSPDSPVYTPNDGHEDWMAAKLNVQTTDVIYGQMVEHLSKVHFLSETVCVALKRHLPDLHPLQQMLKFHCREVLVPNVIGAPILLDPVKGLTNFLFATGHTGAKLLIDRAYRYTTWDVTDFWGNIQVVLRLWLVQYTSSPSLVLCPSPFAPLPSSSSPAPPHPSPPFSVSLYCQGSLEFM